MTKQHDAALRATVFSILKMYGYNSVPNDMICEIIDVVDMYRAPKPIDSAPAGDGWIMAQVERDFGPPWAMCTRGDGGWYDDEGYPVEPKAWFPLPDPQPEPTGWRAPVGSVRIAPVIRSEIAWARFLVYVALPSGEDDLTREPQIARDLDDARRRASELSAQLRLPIEEPPEVADTNVLAFDPARRTPR